MYLQRANIPLLGLDIRALTVGAISGPNSQIGALHWWHFTSYGFIWLHSGKAERLTLASGGSEHA